MKQVALRVTDVQPLDGYRLRVSFNDGVIRDVDFADDLEKAEGSLAEPLRDLAYFRQVRVDEYSRTIVWPNGLDAAPEVLHGDFEPAGRLPNAPRQREAA
jgi:hypothetical protein